MFNLLKISQLYSSSQTSFYGLQIFFRKWASQPLENLNFQKKYKKKKLSTVLNILNVNEHLSYMKGKRKTRSMLQPEKRVQSQTNTKKFVNTITAMTCWRITINVGIQHKKWIPLLNFVDANRFPYLLPRWVNGGRWTGATIGNAINSQTKGQTE